MSRKLGSEIRNDSIGWAGIHGSSHARLDGMLWFFVAILGSAAYGLDYFVDKVFVSKYVKDPWTYYLWWGIYWFEACALLVIMYPAASAFNFWASLAGGVQAIAATLYLRAILREEVSRVAPFLYLSPLFSLVFSLLFLDESIATTALLGILILVAGAFLMGSREPWKLSLSAGAKLAILNAVMIGFYSVALKLSTNVRGRLDVMFWTWLTYGIVVFVVAHRHLPTLVTEFRHMPRRVKAVLAGMVFVLVAASASLIYAYSLADPPLVAAVSASSPLFVFLFTLAAGTLAPRLLKEDAGARNMVSKLVGAMMIVLGVFLIS